MTPQELFDKLRNKKYWIFSINDRSNDIVLSYCKIDNLNFKPYANDMVTIQIYKSGYVVIGKKAAFIKEFNCFYREQYIGTYVISKFSTYDEFAEKLNKEYYKFGGH